MKLHENTDEFKQLITLASRQYHIPELAVARDYYIIHMLELLTKSDYGDKCVFKGGTSLSKCYPGSIERFSEDIDLTFMGMDLSDKQCSKWIKKIEEVMTEGAHIELIPSERSPRSKSLYAWYGDKNTRIKLEIGSSIKPEPYSKRSCKSYIHTYLETKGFENDIERLELCDIEINVLDISRTFVDKLMAVKRHAICGTLDRKVRHIYDVVQLYQMKEIQFFLQDKFLLKQLMQLTKETDSFYLNRRNISEKYDPTGPYAFYKWEKSFDNMGRSNYGNLHKDLLYTDEPQSFDDAVKTFEAIDALLKDIDE